MSISKVSLCLIFLTFLTSPLVLCSRSPKMAVAATAAIEKKLQKTHVHPPVLPVLESTEVDSSPSMVKIDDEPATNSAISGFFRSKFPFQGWPFHKYGSFPMAKPASPSVPTTTPATGAEEEESEKVPSSPSKGNRDGGNA
ncbi:Tapetum specific protein TAP35/TAP44 [Raphanus sativus]|uniref:Uncharacterized protein LOC130505841 n=1 Tax=Raphanus sativus TaxID=3726 RepID=A0A9W3CXX0_RAPSA|nr:uncharacterized protein LOC130505841 [Raphanus sativus]KAJ4867610.1 Tapetum specific protein TAP35/TAP44 [Raphanus sativus]